jgi:hypothetical protein
MGHCNVICLQDVVFKVSEAGRQRVLREKRKNVHAGVEGVMCEDGFWTKELNDGSVPVTYNPYFMRSFQHKDLGLPVYEAKSALLDCNAPVKVLASM